MAYPMEYFSLERSLISTIGMPRIYFFAREVIDLYNWHALQSFSLLERSLISTIGMPHSQFIAAEVADLYNWRVLRLFLSH